MLVCNYNITVLQKGLQFECIEYKKERRDKTMLDIFSDFRRHTNSGNEGAWERMALYDCNDKDSRSNVWTNILPFP